MAPSPKKKIPWFSSQKFNSSKTINSSFSNWMSKIKDEISIRDLSIPGSHDSATSLIEKIPIINFYLDWNVKTQVWSIKEQLLSGIRYFDLRPGKNKIIYHGSFKTNETFDHVIHMISHFLNNNPSEGIIMRIQFQSKNEDNAKIIFPVFEEYKNYFLFSNDIPLMKDIRKKIFVISDLFSYNDTMRLYKSDKIFMQDYFKLNGIKVLEIKKKKKLASECLEMTNDNRLLLNHFSGIGWRIFSTTKFIAFRINQVLFEANNYKGIQIMDYPSEFIIQKIIEQNFNFMR